MDCHKGWLVSSRCVDRRLLARVGQGAVGESCCTTRREGSKPATNYCARLQRAAVATSRVDRKAATPTLSSRPGMG